MNNLRQWIRLLDNFAEEGVSHLFKSNLRAIKALPARAKRLIQQRLMIQKGKQLCAISKPSNRKDRKEFLKQVNLYWKKYYGKAINPVWHDTIANVTGIEDVRFIPHHIWFFDILPYYNDLTLRPAYKDKNLSDILLSYNRKPEVTLKRMHGRYFDAGNRPITRADALERIVCDQKPKIVKPSRTNNGEMIQFLEPDGGKIYLNKKPCTLDQLERSYGANYLIQAKVVQNELMASVHPESLNTIRMVTFRWNDAICNLLAFARFGSGGKITDNAGTGGICCGINDDGTLHNRAVDIDGRLYREHPTTRFSFESKITIPGYRSICETALRLHRQIFHFDIISWDFALEKNQEEPLLMEMNYYGVSYIYQFACSKPIFGDLTEDVLSRVKQTGLAMHQG
jgi:hypothetical protein